MGACGAVIVGVVGPCSSGKSALVRRLRDDGYTVREIRQEHSEVPDMWRRITNPDVLIYLDVTVECAAVRERLNSPSSWWQHERTVRLAHARAHCDLYIDTTPLSPVEVYGRAVKFLSERCEVSRG
jgi:hypothetical protein